MDGEGVEKLVGQDAAPQAPQGKAGGGDGGRRGLSGGGGKGIAVQAQVAEGAGEGFGQAAGRRQDVAGKLAVAGARFHHVERSGTVQQQPELVKLDGQEGAKGGMGLGSGVVVAPGAEGRRRVAGGGRGGRVVAAVGPVEGDVHELGEGNGALLGDAAADFGFGVHSGGIIPNWGGPHPLPLSREERGELGKAGPVVQLH